VPAGRGDHLDRKLDLAASGRRPFGDELGNDPARVDDRWGEQKCEEDQQAAEHHIGVIASSEATKQSRLRLVLLDCFAALAMTALVQIRAQPAFGLF
jgi:hypothetical protein